MKVVCPLCGGNLSGFYDPIIDKTMLTCKGESCELRRHSMAAEAWLILAEQQQAWRDLREISQDKALLVEAVEAVKKNLDAVWAVLEFAKGLIEDECSEPNVEEFDEAYFNLLRTIK